MEIKVSAPGDADPRGVAMFGPIRRIDEIDAAREVSAWFEATALNLTRIPNEEIKTEREDFGVRVYWRENKPHAVMLTIRDGLNFTFGMGFDLSALAASEADRVALERRVAELEGALRPFVALAKYVKNRRDDEFVGYPIEVKQLHAAARALTPGASS